METSREGGLLQESEKDVVFKKLQRLHIAATIFMGVQTVAYAVVGADVHVNPSVGMPKTCNGPICEANLKTLGETNPIWIITLFVCLAACDHLVTTIISYTNPFLAKYWLFDVESNPLRWLEYSISGSIMAVAISILSGVHDVHLWFLILFMHFVGMFIGFILELLPRSEVAPSYPIKMSTLRSVTYWLGTICFIIPWMVIFCYFFTAVSRDGADVPDFVYAAFLGTFILFSTFGINSYLCHVHKLYDFHTAEMIYIILSFTAKTFLAADVFGGLNAQSDDDDYNN